MDLEGRHGQARTERCGNLWGRGNTRQVGCEGAPGWSSWLGPPGRVLLVWSSWSGQSTSCSKSVGTEIQSNSCSNYVGIESDPIHVLNPSGPKPIQFMVQIRWNRSKSNSFHVYRRSSGRRRCLGQRQSLPERARRGCQTGCLIRCSRSSACLRMDGRTCSWSGQSSS